MSVESDLNAYLDEQYWNDFFFKRRDELMDCDIHNAIHEYGSLGAALQSINKDGCRLEKSEVLALLDKKDEYEHLCYDQIYGSKDEDEDGWYN